MRIFNRPWIFDENARCTVSCVFDGPLKPCYRVCHVAEGSFCSRESIPCVEIRIRTDLHGTTHWILSLLPSSTQDPLYSGIDTSYLIAGSCVVNLS